MKRVNVRGVCKMLEYEPCPPANAIINAPCTCDLSLLSHRATYAFLKHTGEVGRQHEAWLSAGHTPSRSTQGYTHDTHPHARRRATRTTHTHTLDAGLHARHTLT